MRRPRRFPHRTILVLALLGAWFGIHPAAASGAAHATASPAAASPAVHAAASRPIAAVTLAARQPAGPSGACSVPGIGDIASVFGFCKLGQSGLSGDLNNICQPSLPDPEPANSGIDAMVRPPASAGKQPATLYGSYGIAGQYWAATNLQCADMTSLIGNNVASMVFDIAKSIDRVTITVYQAAAGEGILSWLTRVVNQLISSLGNAIYFPYLSAVVIIGAIWLAWQGLIRRRATRTIEGTIWMVVACAAAIWLIGRPADFTGTGTAVSNGISQTLNTAFSKLPAPNQSNCLPATGNDPQAHPATYNFSSNNGLVAENANELWAVLVCKPWLAGEFGTTSFGTGGSGQTLVNTYGRQLLWAQAIATNEKQSAVVIQAKQATFSGIAMSIQQKDPGTYPLFQGKQWTTRLEIALAALFAAAIAGVLVLLIAVTLILLKLGFLLLLVAGPFFLLIGTHPGFGRVVALRWFEMLVGVLLKQAAVALVLSVLLYTYSLIMGTPDTVLPWALKILMIALVTVAVFIYRRPFQHLFSAVGYGAIGATERAEIDLERQRVTLRASTLSAAAAAVPGVAAYRAARWARRNPSHAGGLAANAGGNDATAGMDGSNINGEDGALVDGSLAAAAGIAPPEGGTRAGSRSGLASRARAWAAAAASDGTGRSAPPLNLPSRQGAGASPGNRGVGSTAGSVPPGRRSADAAATAAGIARPGQPAAAQPAAAHPGTVRPGPARPGQAVPAGPAPARPSHAQPDRSSSTPAPATSAPIAAASARPAPARPTPARRWPGGPGPGGTGPSGPGPGGAAPSGPGPGGAGPASPPYRPAGTASPRRPGVSPRPPQAAPAALDPAPAGPASRSRGGPWADSSAGRQSAAPARHPSPPSAAGRSSPPPDRQPSPGQRSAPGRRPAAGPAGELSRDDGLTGPPLAGSADGDRPRDPAPFWLRPIRRRK